MKDDRLHAERGVILPRSTFILVVQVKPYVYLPATGGAFTWCDRERNLALAYCKAAPAVAIRVSGGPRMHSEA